MALDPTDLSNFELLSNLQGNILKGHGRDHTANIFIHFDVSNILRAKNWIRNFAEDKIISTQKQLKQREIFRTNKIPAGLFAAFYLSASGYKALGFTLLPADLSFNQGMRSEEVNSKLKDPNPSTWDKGYHQDINAMILLAHDDIDELGKISKSVIDEIDRKFCRVCQIEYGHVIRNENGDGIEHFGYADGISQPLFLKDEVEAFRRDKTLPLQWDPEFSTDLVLVPDPLVNNPAAKGSYFVYRKLEQRVRAFKEAEEKLGEDLKLKGEDAERAGAMLVGRFEDGTPVTLNKEAGIIASGAENNFNYLNDADGAKCPFHAHIRKSNPRGANLEPPELERLHTMARRGIPYGNRDVGTHLDPSIAQTPEAGVGLLFMSFQANLSNQFEFIQEKWVNNTDFPGDDNGSDPILGQGVLSTGKFAKIYNDPTSLDTQSFDSFVTLKGGEYFFAPSIPFLKGL